MMVHKTRNEDMILNIVLRRVSTKPGVKHCVDTKYQSRHSSGKPNNMKALLVRMHRFD